MLEIKDKEASCLRARQVREHAQGEQDELAGRRRALERGDEREHHAQEERVEDVLRHHLTRVEQRRQRDGEERREQREACGQDASCEEERGHCRERDDEGVDRLDGRVCRRERVEQRVGGRDHERVHEAVGVGGDAADRERRPVGKPAGELRVDQLVDHDPRRLDPAREQEPDER
jgi:hypothetical protein